jgi:hypothetical protein
MTGVAPQVEIRGKVVIWWMAVWGTRTVQRCNKAPELPTRIVGFSVAKRVWMGIGWRLLTNSRHCCSLVESAELSITTLRRWQTAVNGTRWRVKRRNAAAKESVDSLYQGAW